MLGKMFKEDGDIGRDGGGMACEVLRDEVGRMDGGRGEVADVVAVVAGVAAGAG